MRNVPSYSAVVWESCVPLLTHVLRIVRFLHKSDFVTLAFITKYKTHMIDALNGNHLYVYKLLLLLLAKHVCMSSVNVVLICLIFNTLETEMQSAGYCSISSIISHATLMFYKT
jgi:hypothetical protein